MATDQFSRRAALGIVAGLAVTAAGCSAAPAARGAEQVTRYSYGDDPSQYAELTLPAGTGPVPVVVVLHGGYWRSSYGAELGRPWRRTSSAGFRHAQRRIPPVGQWWRLALDG